MKSKASIMSLLSFVSSMALLPAVAQAEKIAVDQLQDIIVTGSRSKQETLTVTTIDQDLLNLTMNTSLDTQLVKLPGVYVQTNSRGETLFYSRGSGERQVAIFFEGAPLNVAWDNRFDISTVPSSMISSISYDPSMRYLGYGPNSAAGAVNLLLNDTDQQGAGKLNVAIGGKGFQTIDGSYGKKVDDLSIQGGLAFLGHDDYPLSGDANIPFNQQSDSSRTNTYKDQTGLAVRFGYDISENWKIGASALMISADKGVAPEGHLEDPADARYWQKPDNDVSMIILNSRYNTGQVYIQGSAWYQNYQEQIDAFTSDVYDVLDERELNKGNSYGARWTTGYEAENWDVSMFSQLSHADHDKITGEIFQVAERELEEFSETLSSTGLTGTFDMGANSRIAVGVGMDKKDFDKTGTKENVGGFTQYTGFASYYTEINDYWSLNAGFSQKGRFPTMRELYDGALKRFLINPALKPEQSRMFDFELSYKQSNYSISVTPYFKSIDDTITQERLDVDGVQKRRRINIKGSRVLGFEVSADWQLTKSFSLMGAVSALDYNIRDAEAGQKPIEIPTSMIWLAAQYDGAKEGVGYGQALFGGVEYYKRSKVWSPNANGDAEKIPSGHQVNFKAGVHLGYFSQQFKGADVYFAVDNLFDELMMPQYGLPAPGRWIKMGVSYSF